MFLFPLLHFHLFWILFLHFSICLCPISPSFYLWFPYPVFLISRHFCLNVSFCLIPPTPLPSPQLNTLMTVQLLASPTLSLRLYPPSAHPFIPPLYPSLVHCKDYIASLHQVIHEPVAIPCSSFSFSCLPSFILPNPHFFLLFIPSFYLSISAASPLPPFSPQFTITMISVSVASLQAAAFMSHL